MKTKTLPRTNLTMSRHDFAAKDRLGRAIGSVVETSEEDVVPMTAEEEVANNARVCPSCDYDASRGDRLGHYFVMNVQATRDGKPYQADSTSYFTSAEARDKAVIKYLRGAQTRADKAS